MDLDGAATQRRQGIAYRDAGVRVGRWIDDNAVIPAPCFLNPVHQFPFKIRLANNQFSSKFTTQLFSVTHRSYQSQVP